jgi:hypothetical protein
MMERLVEWQVADSGRAEPDLNPRLANPDAHLR